MNAARAAATATLLNDGRVLIAGGFATGFSPLSSTELFDGTSSFAGDYANDESRPAPRPPPSLLTTNKVLIAGGTLDASVELFDPVNNCFDGSSSTGCSGLTTPTMGAARSNPTATLLSNGNVLIVGGEIDPSPATPADLYDPAHLFAGESGTPCQSEIAPVVNDSSIDDGSRSRAAQWQGADFCQPGHVAAL